MGQEAGVTSMARLLLDLGDDLEGVAALAVHLVAEGQDGEVAQAADLEELAGLGFDALGAVDDHDGGVHGRERAVGVLGEVEWPGVSTRLKRKLP
jgi:hypothetical protein